MDEDLNTEVVSDTPIESSEPEVSTSETAPGTVESQPEVTATESADPGQAAAPQFTSIRDYLASKKYDASRYQTDEEAVESLLSLRQQAEQANQAARYWQQIAQQRAQQEALQAQVAAQPPVEKKPYWSKPPEFDPNWRNLLRKDEQGNIVPVPGAAPDLAQKYQAYINWQQEQQAKLLQDPVEAIWPGMEERLEAKLAEREQKILQTYQQDYDARQYYQQIVPRLYQFTQDGQPIVDPTTGQQAFSPWGTAFNYYLNEAVQRGADVQMRRHYAEQMANAHVAQLQYQQQQYTQPTPAPTTNEERKRQYAAQPTRHQPNRGGTVEVSRDNQVDQNPSHDLRDMLLKDFKRAGILQASSY